MKSDCPTRLRLIVKESALRTPQTTVAQTLFNLRGQLTKTSQQAPQNSLSATAEITKKQMCRRKKAIALFLFSKQDKSVIDSNTQMAEVFYGYTGLQVFKQTLCADCRQEASGTHLLFQEFI